VNGSFGAGHSASIRQSIRSALPRLGIGERGFDPDAALTALLKVSYVPGTTCAAVRA
jgi:hypothetical protein